MDFYSEDYIRFQYRSLIPQRFWRRLNIDQFTPLILDPWHRPYTRHQADDGIVQTFSQAASCAIRFGDEINHILVPKDVTPMLFSGVIHVGKTFFSKDRVKRYMNLFKSYESIVDDRRIEFSAIRHSLSHPGEKLSHRNTVKTLRSIFNDTVIDLDNYYHLKEFYYYFGLLLIENDARLHSLLIKKLAKAREIAPGYFLLT